MEYRRDKTPGATYFFTVITYQRQPILHLPENIHLLRQSFHYVKQRHPFEIDAIVILPDHIHCLWTMPPEVSNFSIRWQLIKSYFSHRCPSKYRQQPSASRLKKQEQAIWQRRFWEHKIRDEKDFANHVDYIHYNPVKHGLVTVPGDWVHSSFHKFIKSGDYSSNWGVDTDISFPSTIGFE